MDNVRPEESGIGEESVALDGECGKKTGEGG